MAAALGCYGENESYQGDMLGDSHQGLTDNVHSNGLSAGRSMLQAMTNLLNQA